MTQRPAITALTLPNPPPWVKPDPGTKEEGSGKTGEDDYIEPDVSPGYVDIPPGRFLIGLAIGSIPLALMQYSNKTEWAGRYILLIVLGFLIVNYRGLKAFTNYIGG